MVPSEASKPTAPSVAAAAITAISPRNRGSGSSASRRSSGRLEASCSPPATVLPRSAASSSKETEEESGSDESLVKREIPSFHSLASGAERVPLPPAPPDDELPDPDSMARSPAGMHRNARKKNARPAAARGLEFFIFRFGARYHPALPLPAEVGFDEGIDVPVHDGLHVADKELGPVVLHEGVGLEYIGPDL